MENQTNKDKAIGVEGDAATASGKVSEAEKIVNATKAKIAEGGSSPVGVSASNSGKGHDPSLAEDGDKAFIPTVIEGSVEEEPVSIEEPVDAAAPAPAEQLLVDSPKDTTRDTPPKST